MAAIPADWGSGGSNQNPKESTTAKPSQAQALRDVADDLADHRAALVVLTQQMDLDAGVTDTDYEANVVTALAALRTTKA